MEINHREKLFYNNGLETIPEVIQKFLKGKDGKNASSISGVP